MDNHPPLPWQPMPPPAADIAAAGPSLPPGWDERRDPTTGRIYYIDHERQITTWDHPNLYRADNATVGVGVHNIDDHNDVNHETVEASSNVGGGEEEEESPISSHHPDEHNPHDATNSEWQYSNPDAETITNTNTNNNENAEEGVQHDEDNNVKEVKEDEEEEGSNSNVANENDDAKEEYAEGGILPPLHSTTANVNEAHNADVNTDNNDDDGDGEEVYNNQQHQQQHQQQSSEQHQDDHLLPEYNHETMKTSFSKNITSSSSSNRALNDKWDKTMEELRTFKQQHGHTNVPQKYGSLGRWVNNQRQFYSKKMNKGEKTSLTEDRVQELDEIGFVWALKSGRTPSKKKEPQSATTSTSSSASTNKKRKRKSSSATKKKTNNDDDDVDDDGMKEVSNTNNNNHDDDTKEKKSKKKKKQKKSSKDDSSSVSPTNASIITKTLLDGTHVITTHEITTHADGSKVSMDVEESISKRLIRTSDGRRVLETTTSVVSKKVEWVVLPELSVENKSDDDAAAEKNQDGENMKEHTQKVDASVAVADALFEEVKKKKKSQPVELSVGLSEDTTVDECVANHANTDATHNEAQSGESEAIQQPAMKADAETDDNDVAIV